MRFLIDTTTARLVRYGKFSRVTRMLASELGDGQGMPVNVLGGDIFIANDRLCDSMDFDPFWEASPRRAPSNVEEILWAARVAAKVFGSSLFSRPIAPEALHDLTWAFAQTFDFFPFKLRRRLGRALGIETDGKRLDLFFHWLAERGAIYQPVAALKGGIKDAITPREGDALILPGASWRYLNINDIGRLRRSLGFALVCFIYDVLPLDYPSLLSVRRYISYRDFVIGAAREADLIIVPNETTLERLRSFLADIPDRRARLTCYSFSCAAMPAAEGKLTARLEALRLQDRPFMLYMSGMRPRKHLLWLYALCTRLRKERADFPLLVIAGSSDLQLTQILQADPDWEKAATFLFNPTDTELAWLYRHTLVSLYPSFEGGLGLCVTEATAYGRPCIAADAPSLIEASAGRAEHLPQDEALWASAITRILDETKKLSPELSHAVAERPGLLAAIGRELEACGKMF